MKIAVFSPLPPQRSGISDYTIDIAADMARTADVHLFLPDSAPASSFTGLPIARYDGYEARTPDLSAYDGIVYHIGNDVRFHGEILAVAARHPGIVVLHDVAVHELVRHFYAGVLGRPDLYLREAEYAHGPSGRRFAEKMLTDAHALAGSVSAMRFPLHSRLVASAVGVVVHSRFAAGLVTTAAPGTPVRVVDHYVPHGAGHDGAAARVALGLEGPVIGSFGHLVPAKRIDVLLDAVARLRPIPTLLLGGSRAETWQRVAEHRYGIGDRVVAIDWSPVDALDLQIAACDVVVNLRHPNMGETSGIANRALAAPRPLVVSTGGWFDELPDDAVARVAPGDDEVTSLTNVLTRLLGSADERDRLCQAAARYAAGRSPGAVAEEYLEFVAERAESGDSARAAMVARIGAEIGLAPVAPSAATIFPILDAARDVLLPRTRPEQQDP